MVWFILAIVWVVLVADAYLLTRSPRARRWKSEFPPLTEDEENELLFGDWPRNGG